MEEGATLLLPPPGLYCPEQASYAFGGGRVPNQRSLTIGVVWTMSVLRRLVSC
jgi:hypothetical protein